jgi:hypothetical protein
MTIVTAQHQRPVAQQVRVLKSKKHTSPVDHGGQLETQALAKRGGCLYKDILAIEGGGDDLALVRPGSVLVMVPCGSLSSLISEGQYLKFDLLNCRRRVKSMSCSESVLARGMATRWSFRQSRDAFLESLLGG